MTAFACLTFATTVWVIHRVHDNTANGWANAFPASCTSFTQTTQTVLFVSDLTQSSTAFDVDLTNLTRTHTDLGVDAFTSQQRSGGASGANDLRAFADLQLNAMHDGADWDIADWQCIANTDWSLSTAHDGCANFKATGGDDVSTLTICIANQGDVRRTVRVILDTLDLGWNSILGTAKVNNTIVMLVTTTFMASRDVTVVIATSVLELWLQQRCIPPPRHRGEDVIPARARPVPFCLNGFLVECLTCSRSF